MKSGRETRKRVREPAERTDVRIIETRQPMARPMDGCFEIAHVTWIRRSEERELVVLGEASEPMS